MLQKNKILACIVFAISFLLNGEVWAQEARPTEVRPPEAGAVSKITPEESESRLQDAKLLFDRGKTDAAIYLLQQLQKADPTNYKVLLKLGEMAIAAKNWAYSITVLRKASFLRPKDIEVRLILMDIYRAYQMPIQEIIVGKEILALDPKHIIATKRLAELYKEQAMLKDEIEIRQKLKRLLPDDYKNLKRLAVVFDESAELWESARIYEQIRKYYPKKVKDMTRLAAIYDKLGESFRGIRVLDQIEEMGEDRGWLKSRAVTNLRSENSLYDPFQSGLTFRKDYLDEYDVFSAVTKVDYTHIRLRSSIDVGVVAKYTRLHHTGKAVLDGAMDINSGTLVYKAVKNWRGQDYRLEASLGFLWDNVSGRLYPNQGSGITSEDYLFLKDPSFRSYGGVMPVGGLKFTAQPGLHSTYEIAYEHGLVEDLDARLLMFYFDKAALSYSYHADDGTEILLQADESAFSDGNSRFHSTVSFYYTLLGSSPMHDYHDPFGLPFWRKDFFRKPPLNFLKFGYIFEFFHDENSPVYYEVLKKERRHKYQLEGQARIHNIGQDRYVFLNFQFAYSKGTTLAFQKHAGVRLFYRDYGSGNEIGLSYAYDKGLSINESSNARVGGKARSSTILAFIKWRF